MDTIALILSIIDPEIVPSLLEGHAEDLLLRVFADRAGVDDDNISLFFVVRQRAAHIAQHTHDALTIRHILLTAVSIHKCAHRAALVRGGDFFGKTLLTLDFGSRNNNVLAFQITSLQTIKEYHFIINSI